MKIEISVPEVVNVFKEIQTQPQKIFEMIRLDVREMVGRYLTEMMNAELTHFLGRDPYERTDGEGDHNYRNGTYGRNFTVKGIGEVSVKVPRDRNGEYQTQVIPRSRQYEDETRERPLFALPWRGEYPDPVYDVPASDRPQALSHRDQRSQQGIDRCR